MTFLGKGRDDPEKGYRTATYRFPDESNVRTSFFGKELAGYLEVSKLVILGTRGSQWGVLVEESARNRDSEQEELRVQLMDAEAEERVEQAQLDGLVPMMTAWAGREVVPRLIPYGKNAFAQML